MIRCPNCGELNGDNREACWKCRASFSQTIKDEKKVCSKCGSVFMSDKKNCPECGGQLVNYSQQAAIASARASDKGENAGCLMIGLAVVIPLLGFIISYIKISDGEIGYGKSLILAGILSILISGFFVFVLKGCTM